MKAPQLTIVIPVHNRADIVSRTLDSVAAQTHRPLALVLVDNASADNSLQVLERWAAENRAPDFNITVFSEPRRGACFARNRGLESVTTEWVMFFDSDDTMAPNHVERAMATASNTCADIIGWDVAIHSLGGKVAIKRFKVSDSVYNCIMHGSMATQRYMARTELVRRAGGWRNDIEVWNDIELGVRMLLQGNVPVLCQGPPTVDIYEQVISISGADYHHNGSKREHSLNCIELSLPSHCRSVVQLKRAVLAALYRREEHHADADRLLGIALAHTHSAIKRMCLRLAYAYTACGARGIATIMKPLFSKQP